MNQVKIKKTIIKAEYDQGCFQITLEPGSPTKLSKQFSKMGQFLKSAASKTATPTNLKIDIFHR